MSLRRSVMSNIYRRFPKRSTWAEFSQRLCKYLRVPYGSKFVLVSANGRQVRDDKIFTRRIISPSVLPRRPRQTVRDILDGIEQMLATPPSQIRCAIEARAPNGQRIDTRTHVETWQAMEPTLTPSQREAKRIRKDEIESFLRPRAALCIEELEEGLEDPEDKVPVALLAELVERYGIDAIRAAISELRV